MENRINGHAVVVRWCVVEGAALLLGALVVLAA